MTEEQILIEVKNELKVIWENIDKLWESYELLGKSYGKLSKRLDRER